MTISISVSKDSNGDVITSEAAEGGASINNASNSRTEGTGLQSRVNNGVSRITIQGGQVTSDSAERVAVTTEGLVQDRLALNPESVMATARSPGGRPLTEADVNDDSLVSIGGLQTTAKVAAMQGVLFKDPETGKYFDSMAASQAAGIGDIEPEEARETVEAFSQNTLNFMSAGTRHFSEAQASQFLLSALDGELDTAGFQRAVESKGGDAAEAAAMFDRAVAGIVNDLTAAVGLDSDDMDETMDGWSALVDALKGSDKGRYQDAMRQLVMIGNAEPLVEFIDAVHRNTGMLDASTPEEAGMQTKVVDGKTLIRHVDADGFEAWTTQEVGRRLGWW